MANSNFSFSNKYNMKVDVYSSTGERITSFDKVDGTSFNANDGLAIRFSTADEVLTITNAIVIASKPK